MTSPHAEPGRVYRHHKGGLYRVLHLARRESDLATLVVYAPLAGYQGVPWVRPLSEWGAAVGGGRRRYEREG